VGKTATEHDHAALLGAAMRLVRKHRRMRASEVARLMNMPPRSYEHLENGDGRISYARLAAFAEATESDPHALLAVIPLASPEFAVRCADNKLMTIILIAMLELDEELSDDIAYLEAGTLVGAMTRLRQDLVRHVRQRETFSEVWLKEGKERLSSTKALGRRLAPRPSRG
jgi:transcriptional regulator with XRE-family HTH domain